MNLTARFHSAIEQLGRAPWESLRADDHPFLAYDFLHGLEQHGCLQRRYGWQPYHLGLYQDTELIAAAPAYLKSNSHGEFVFDHSWAEAFLRYGFEYYPKLLCAVPYSPVNGPRLLTGKACDTSLRQALLAALRAEVERRQWSSAHLNFPSSALAAPDWIARLDWQFHWHNAGWRDFQAFLAALSSKKRKNILHERAQVARSGLRVQRRVGAQISPADMRTMFEFYLDTFERKGNHPALTLEFFLHLHATMPDQLMLALADRDGETVAGALFLFDQHALYGRYWGAQENAPGLHFELCYYQGIEFCLERGLQSFEPGAQGEHKIARGFLPSQTRSLHYIRDPRFRDAIAAAVREETAWIKNYGRELQQHSPYRAGAEPTC